MSKETATLLDDEIPEKFRDPETGDLRLDSLLQSYKQLERRMSSSPAAPKSPDEYCIDCAHGMFQPDAEVNRRLHAMGLNNEQAQEVYNIAAEKLVPMVAELMQDYQADREIEKLINHFGGAEQWKEVSRQLLAFGRQNMPAEVLDNLSSSYEGVLALHRMMKSDEPVFQREDSSVAANAVGEKDLQSMMRDPKYWRDRDPAYVEKVTKGFQTLYSGR